MTSDLRLAALDGNKFRRIDPCWPGKLTGSGSPGRL